METMRAARLVEPGRMECEEVAVPEPGEGQVLVKTEMASICGSDLHVVFENMFRQELPAPPGYPGHEGVGEVVASRFPGLQPGDKVLTCPNPFTSMTFAETQLILGRYCIKLPEFDGPVSHLMMAQQFGTVIFALRQKPVDVVGRSVMVMGQGSAGMFFAFMLRRAGAAKVIVSDLSEARLDASRRLARPDVAVPADVSRVREAVMDLTGGEGVDYLVEAVGKSDSLLESVNLARDGGEMLMFGLPDAEHPVTFDFHRFFRKRLGMTTTFGAQDEPGQVSFRMALDLITQGEIDVSPLVSHQFPIENIQEAFLTAQERRDNALKVSMTF